MTANTLKFLNTLAQNNEKGWMDENRDWFLEVKEEFLEKVGDLLTGLKRLDPGLESLNPKDCVFRQNRDIRFSPNKMPYKINMAAYFSRGGKKSVGPGYYLHLEPEGSFVGGGLYHPPAPLLKQVRQEIDYSGNELKTIMDEPEFKKTFGGLYGEKLKTSPRDYDQDHQHIDLLRYKSFEVITRIPDQEIEKGTTVKIALDTFTKMQPYMDFLYRATDDAESGDGLLL
ncbi:DUF2461 domain-containing protein [Litoribacter alkaliphilus]|uniref:DUF2461 domain-containing protein n=1 Tax=Litoribacter ruber TaxID=702568 RepID=A0AAP2CF64_9BACT|nr:DUF2461 domain-containing protein [Litoribacter alkaliphilus]MBS9522550.1 DUF2461 domain-containing protein [Litoribacter alkaliphilus]